jgi:tripartite-type tricarboxylate transporter receptor subunit TctC
VVVENRSGAGSVIGTENIVRSAPDGYSLLLAAPHLVINPSLKKSMPYDAEKDLAPISQLVSSPTVLLVNPSLPVKNVRELVAYAKANPGKLSYGSSGSGTSGHLGMELINQMGEIDMVHIPYKGVGPALTDLMSGQTQVMFAPLQAARLHIDSGKVRPLAVATGKRSRIMPDLPTVAESGLPGFQVDAWYGLLAPAGTPKPVILKLHGALKEIMHMPDVLKRIEVEGADPVVSTPSEFAVFIKAEIPKWQAIVKKSGATLD